MTMFLIIVLVIMVLLLLSKPRQAETPMQRSQECQVQESNEDASYLYYINRHGELIYDSENCRGCIENEAERLRRKGFVVTEVVLGRKYSGDL